MITYAITFAGSGQLELSAGIDAQVLPALSAAVTKVGLDVRADWQERVLRAKLWSVEKDAYAASIKFEKTGDFTATVSSDYKYAFEIETGLPARDLKQMLNTSLKVRRTKDGRRFLVIPMRQNRSSMPAAIKQRTSKLSVSSILGQGQRAAGQVTNLSPHSGMAPSGKQTPYLSNPSSRKAVTVVSNKYAWGGRLTRAALRDMGASKEDQKRFAGMVRMDTSTPGGKKDSAAMTFRIMMEGKPNWIIPAQPGLWIALAVTGDMEPKATAVFQEAIASMLKQSNG